MSRDKMIPKAPTPNGSGLTPFERAADLTRRIIAVPKAAIVLKPRKALRKHR